MVTQVDVVNQSLQMIANRTTISSFTENSPAAQSAALFYSSVVESIFRGASWEFARRTQLLTLLKAAIINGQPSTDPPPQPFYFEYTYPSDCIKARFLLPYLTVTQSGGVPFTTAPNLMAPAACTPTGIPFVIGTDYDQTAQPVKVILTNLPTAQLVYTQNLSQYPNLWDPLFVQAVVATLGVYFANALSGDMNRVNSQTAIAKGILDKARAENGNESMGNQDRFPDWLQARWSMGPNNSTFGNGINGVGYATWDAVSFPGGLSY